MRAKWLRSSHLTIELFFSPLTFLSGAERLQACSKDASPLKSYENKKGDYFQQRGQVVRGYSSQSSPAAYAGVTASQMALSSPSPISFTLFNGAHHRLKITRARKCDDTQLGLFFLPKFPDLFLSRLQLVYLIPKISLKVFAHPLSPCARADRYDASARVCMNGAHHRLKLTEKRETFHLVYVSGSGSPFFLYDCNKWLCIGIPYPDLVSLGRIQRCF